MIPVRATFLSVPVFLCTWPATAAAQTPAATLPSECYDQQVAPASVIVACADAGAIAEQLVWTGWGEAHASATGCSRPRPAVRTARPAGGRSTRSRSSPASSATAPTASRSTRS